MPRVSFRCRAAMPVIVAALLANCLFPSGASAKTPPDLDAVVERFKVAAEHEQRLDLAFQGLDRYAPIKEKSAVDRTDRDALSEMKRLVVMDLVRKHSAKALVTAIGSGGTWLIEPGRIKNDYDEKDEDGIARDKHEGYYMEGLSDLDLVIMGPDARTLARRFYDTLSAGRAGADLVPQELDALELNFLVDDQIQDLAGGGDRRKFWKQMMDLSRSAVHPEKYITKGGKALYCVEHLGERGAALEVGGEARPQRFSAWCEGAGQVIGPFTAQYLYGGACDMDYFIRHAFAKGEQEKVKTVLQVVKYLERDRWMIRQTVVNAGKLPPGLTILPDRIEHYEARAAELAEFCRGAIADRVWKSGGAFAEFAGKALAESGEVCQMAHGLAIGMGRDLLIRVDQGRLTDEQAVMLDEIAYDLDTVHNNRYQHGRPSWYEVHEQTIKNETISFLADFAERKPKVHTVFARAGVLPPKDPALQAVEVGPIEPPPVVTLRIDSVKVAPSEVEAGSEAVITATCTLDGVLDKEPDWEANWLTAEQAGNARQVAVWSWLSALRRRQILYLVETDLRNKAAAKAEDRVYVSPYEIKAICEEELSPCEEEVKKYSELLGLLAPQIAMRRFTPSSQSASTLAAVSDYLKAVEQTCVTTRTVLETVNGVSNSALTMIQSVKTEKSVPGEVSRAVDVLKEVRAETQAKMNTVAEIQEYVDKAKGWAESLQKISSGDTGEMASKAKEMEAYLDTLGSKMALAKEAAVAAQNQLASGINLFRRCAATVPRSEYGELYTGLTRSIREWDQKKNDIMLKEVPALEEMAKWTERGAWAAWSARWALSAVSLYQDYKSASDQLQGTDLARQSESAVLALKACGDIIDWAADKIPLAVLRQAIKDYAGLLKSAPQWSAAFDTLIRRQSQGMGYDTRALIPAAYESLMENHKQLDAGEFYRYEGPKAPFAYHNNLTVLGHPMPEDRDPARAKAEAGQDHLWLIWDKHNPQGYVRLGPENFKRASLYAAWYRRVNGRPITGPELKDLLLNRKIEGGVLRGQTVTADELERKAADALRFESLKDYLGTTSGKTAFEPDEVRRYYGMLDRAARRLAEAGFVMSDDDVRDIVTQVKTDPPISGGWAAVFKSLPLTAAAGDLVNAGSNAWDSLSGGEKSRLEAAVASLLQRKTQQRAAARKKFWAEVQETTPAGLTLDAIRISARHSLLGDGLERSEMAFLKPADRTFTLTWKTRIPETHKGTATYLCSAVIAGYNEPLAEQQAEFSVAPPVKEGLPFIHCLIGLRFDAKVQASNDDRPTSIHLERKFLATGEFRGSTFTGKIEQDTVPGGATEEKTRGTFTATLGSPDRAIAGGRIPSKLAGFSADIRREVKNRLGGEIHAITEAITLSGGPLPLNEQSSLLTIRVPFDQFLRSEMLRRKYGWACIAYTGQAGGEQATGAVNLGYNSQYASPKLSKTEQLVELQGLNLSLTFEF